MFGTGPVEELRAKKEALLLESSLNRLKLQADLQSLRGLMNPAAGLAGKAQGLLPWLTLLAPLAGFFAFRGLRRSGSFTGKLASAARLGLQAYQLWRRFF